MSAEFPFTKCDPPPKMHHLAVALPDETGKMPAPHRVHDKPELLAKIFPPADVPDQWYVGQGMFVLLRRCADPSPRFENLILGNSRLPLDLIRENERRCFQGFAGRDGP